MPERFAGKLGFNLELVPSTLLGKPWIMDNRTGVFPHQAMGPTMKQSSNMEHIGDFNPDGKVDLDQLLLDRKTYNPMIADDIVSAPLAAGKKFVLNPQDDLAKITIESEKGDLLLYDGRINHNNGWFVLRSEFPAGTKEGAVKWIIRPTVTKDWRYAPVVQASQVGYHPGQKKVAVIELDKRDTDFKQPALYRIAADGRKLVKQQAAKDWGDFQPVSYTHLSSARLTSVYAPDGGYQNVLKEYINNAWSSSNTGAKYPRITKTDYNKNMRVSDAYIQKGDYLKISNIQIGYTFPKNVLKPVKMENARVFASVDNVCTISSYNKFGDPEVGDSNVLYSGFDGGRYPFPMSVTFGLSVQF